MLQYLGNPMKAKLRNSQAFPPLLLVLCISVAIFLGLSLRFSGFAADEFMRFNRGMADSSADNADQVLERLKGFALNRLEDADLLAWLSNPEPDALADYKAEWGLLRSFAAEPFVAGALLLAPDRGYLLDTRSRRWAWATYPDQGMLESVSRSFPYLRMAAGGAGQSAWLALPLPLDYGSEGANRALARRSVVLILDRSLIEKYILRSARGGAPFRAFVLDESGGLVLGQAPESASAPELWPSLVGRGRLDLRTRLGSQAWLLSARPLEREDWTLVSAARLEELGERAVQFELLLVLALAALVLLYWIGLKWSQARLLRPFRSMEAEHRALARQEALRRLLSSGSLDPRDEALLRADYGFEALSGFALCAARIESFSSWRASASPEARRASIASVLRAWEEGGRSLGLSCIGLDQGGDTLLLAAQERGAPPSQARADELLLSLRPAPAAGEGRLPALALSACEILPGRDDIGFALESLRELGYLKFLSGEDKVYREGDMAKTLDRQPIQAVQEEADELALAVRSASPAELAAALSAVKSRLSGLPYSECRLRLVTISFIIFKEFSLQLAADGGFQGLERGLGSFDNLGSALAWIGGKLSEVQSRLSAPDRDERRLELIEDAESFVRDQLSDFTLNLDRVAAQVGLSAGYLRQVYKEVRGRTLSDFIHRERIERIKEQLEHEDLPISRIIERSGFQTKSHFFTSFKEATGMTPDQYRRMKREVA